MKIIYSLKCNIVKLLLDKGADVNVKNASGNSVLIYSAEWNRIIIVKMLINKYPDIDITIKNNLDQTPYLVASVEGNGRRRIATPKWRPRDVSMCRLTPRNSIYK